MSKRGRDSSSPGVASEVTGHLQVRGSGRDRKYFALWVDALGVKRTRTLGRAHVKDTGRRTRRGAVVWRAGDGDCPRGALTPKMAEAALAEILDDARAVVIESSAQAEDSEFAGHADVKTTMRYVHHQTKADDAVVGGAYLDRALEAGESVGTAL